MIDQLNRHSSIEIQGYTVIKDDKLFIKDSKGEYTLLDFSGNPFAYIRYAEYSSFTKSAGDCEPMYLAKDDYSIVICQLSEIYTPENIMNYFLGVLNKVSGITVKEAYNDNSRIKTEEKLSRNFAQLTKINFTYEHLKSFSCVELECIC